MNLHIHAHNFLLNIFFGPEKICLHISFISCNICLMLCLQYYMTFRNKKIVAQKCHIFKNHIKKLKFIVHFLEFYVQMET